MIIFVLYVIPRRWKHRSRIFEIFSIYLRYLKHVERVVHQSPNGSTKHSKISFKLINFAFFSSSTFILHKIESSLLHVRTLTWSGKMRSCTSLRWNKEKYTVYRYERVGNLIVLSPYPKIFYSTMIRYYFLSSSFVSTFQKFRLWVVLMHTCILNLS